jgi:hypothetical protein
MNRLRRVLGLPITGSNIKDCLIFVQIFYFFWYSNYIRITKFGVKALLRTTGYKVGCLYWIDANIYQGLTINIGGSIIEFNRKEGKTSQRANHPKCSVHRSVRIVRTFIRTLIQGREQLKYAFRIGEATKCVQVSIANRLKFRSNKCIPPSTLLWINNSAYESVSEMWFLKCGY